MIWLIPMTSKVVRSIFCKQIVNIVIYSIKFMLYLFTNRRCQNTQFLVWLLNSDVIYNDFSQSLRNIGVLFLFCFFQNPFFTSVHTSDMIMHLSSFQKRKDTIPHICLYCQDQITATFFYLIYYLISCRNFRSFKMQPRVMNSQTQLLFSTTYKGHHYRSKYKVSSLCYILIKDSYIKQDIKYMYNLTQYSCINSSLTSVLIF